MFATERVAKNLRWFIASVCMSVHNSTQEDKRKDLENTMADPWEEVVNNRPAYIFTFSDVNMTYKKGFPWSRGKERQFEFHERDTQMSGLEGYETKWNFKYRYSNGYHVTVHFVAPDAYRDYLWAGHQDRIISAARVKNGPTLEVTKNLRESVYRFYLVRDDGGFFGSDGERSWLHSRVIVVWRHPEHEKNITESDRVLEKAWDFV